MDSAAVPDDVFTSRTPARLYGFEKRLLDLLVASLALVLLSPLWLLVAVLIKLTSPGPVLFTRTVVGRECRPFRYYKFRSMRIDADDAHHRAFLQHYVKEDRPYALEVDPKTGRERPIYKVINDHRVTPVGRIIRRLSIDEVPQLLNVIKGEMSIVGPRPPILHEFELYDEWAKARLSVLPGITGLAQVRARGQASFKEMVWIDLEYISRRSLLLDIMIMLRTIPVVLLGRGAH